MGKVLIIETVPLIKMGRNSSWRASWQRTPLGRLGRKKGAGIRESLVWGKGCAGRPDGEGRAPLVFLHIPLDVGTGAGHRGRFGLSFSRLGLGPPAMPACLWTLSGLVVCGLPADVLNDPTALIFRTPEFPVC